MSGSQYERELKGILEGEDKVLSKITKTCPTIERINYLKIHDKPFAVIRAAGSLGVDLVAVRGDISFLVEIKSSVENKIHFSSVGGKLQKQAEIMRDICEKTKTLPIYAFRLKNYRGDSWRIFTMTACKRSIKEAFFKKEFKKELHILTITLTQTEGLWSLGTKFRIRILLSGPYKEYRFIQGLPRARMMVMTRDNKDEGIIDYSTESGLLNIPIILEIYSESDIDIAILYVEPYFQKQ